LGLAVSIEDIPSGEFFWVIESACQVLQKSYDLSLVKQQFAPPYSDSGLKNALLQLGINTTKSRLNASKLSAVSVPALVWLSDTQSSNKAKPAIVLGIAGTNAILLRPGFAKADNIPIVDLQKSVTGTVHRLTVKEAEDTDPDAAIQNAQARAFGFGWFVIELGRYKRLWNEIFLASLVIQLLALAAPLFTQTIIDKVIVNRTQSTLFVVLVGMGIFMLFTAVLSWLRQYLVLHTGNRVDAVLGAAVLERLFKLPPMYFQHRPVGVISARLHGVETVREFIASAAVTLILDFPFLLIFVAIMFYYSVTLSMIVMGTLLIISLMSLWVAPLFQKKLQTQFQLGARNQAFVTEYVSGLETVKSLQLEPQLSSQYRQFLASYLAATFATKQLANSYNSTAQLLEQVMNLLILGVGAWLVMQSNEFTIGMLIAFQMFASRVSQPMLRLVGLWQQFQQAQLSVDRLGDLMNAPIEPYNLSPKRLAPESATIEFESLSFRYSEKLPWLYKNLQNQIMAGQTIAIMGPSGCGKSTLAKLLQGFYQPSEGRIKIGGIDISNLSANELRNHFGVVPQETVLFSGTVLENLQKASPEASFEEIVAACRQAEIHAVVEAMPEGYQSVIGERGAGLSGGQRQRIAIARALLKKPRILIFDEATSALDAASAEQFAKTINGLPGDITKLFIAHGLPRSLKVDQVLLLTPTGLEPIRLAIPK
jgi:ATP-binding cassette, subfamily B, bacterial HlyB/CyaB